jgi:hypothetical protein
MSKQLLPTRIDADPQFAAATLPTSTTRWMRTFLPWQLVRFVMINLKMFRIIWRSHGGG